MPLMGRWLLGMCLSLSGIFGQQADLLASVKQKVTGDLTKLPDHLCTATIEQSRIGIDGEPADTNRIRLDVGYLRGKQIFGWPGGASLSEFNVSRLVPGLVTDGDLVALGRLLLLSKPLITGHHEGNHSGRPTVRYDYRVPLEESGWMLQRLGVPMRVGYRGYFHVDASSLDVIQLVMAAENLPQQDIQSVDRTVQYRRAYIGSRDLLLPVRAVLLMTALNGHKDKTETRFNNCRQYTAESVVRFDLEGPAVAVKPSSASAPLPDDFIVEIALETEIDSDHAAVGDPVIAKLRRDAGKSLRVPVANDSLLHGRINRLEVIDGQRRLDIVFDHVELNGAKIYIRSRRNRLVSKSKAGWMPDPIRGAGRRIHLQRGYTLLFRSTAMYGR
jgi:hypothetical protein